MSRFSIIFFVAWPLMAADHEWGHLFEESPTSGYQPIDVVINGSLIRINNPVHLALMADTIGRKSPFFKWLLQAIQHKKKSRAAQNNQSRFQGESYFEEPLFSLKDLKPPVLAAPEETTFKYYELHKISQWEKPASSSVRNPFRPPKKNASSLNQKSVRNNKSERVEPNKRLKKIRAR